MRTIIFERIITILIVVGACLCPFLILVSMSQGDFIDLLRGLRETLRDRFLYGLPPLLILAACLFGGGAFTNLSVVTREATIAFRHFCSGSLTLASLNHACRN